VSTERRAPVQAERQYPQLEGHPRKQAGTITWAEHEEAWAGYYAATHSNQSAEVIAERGGFGYFELVRFLGREPTTWEVRP
jgi:predicted fused transcriptional regulator/phosphomethylpyrimidine kinase